MDVVFPKCSGLGNLIQGTPVPMFRCYVPFLCLLTSAYSWLWGPMASADCPLNVFSAPAPSTNRLSLYLHPLSESQRNGLLQCHSLPSGPKGSLGRSLVLSHLTPWGHKESDTTQWLNNSNRPWINVQPDPRWSGCSPWWGGWNNIWPPTPWRGQRRYWTINTTVSVSPVWQPATNWRSITGRLKSNKYFSGALRVPPSPHPSLVKYTEIKIKSG